MRNADVVWGMLLESFKNRSWEMHFILILKQFQIFRLLMTICLSYFKYIEFIMIVVHDLELLFNITLEHWVSDWLMLYYI